MTKLLATEKQFLRVHQKELAEQHPGQFLLIKGEKVHGAFQTYEEGVSAAARLFGAGPCLVRSVLQPEDSPPLYVPALALGIPMSIRPSGIT